jgi:transposase
MNREALSRLSKDELIDVILAQARRIELLGRRIADLEAKLGGPPKTSDNSSLPPSRDRKANKPERPPGARREASVGRAGGGRRLHPHPDRVVDAVAERCPHCRAVLGAAAQRPLKVYDKIELPVVRPLVTRVILNGCRCRRCGRRVVAPAPAGLEPGSPFGRSVAALAVYLRYAHAVSYQRLAALFGHLFGLEISEGALANLLARAKPLFDGAAKRLRTRLRRARLICSDETSARVAGRNQWEWVFQNEALSLHVIRPSRGRAVPVEVLAGHRPQAWVSDLWGAQRGHADAWQICLAHQLRDCTFAVDAGDTIFAPAVKQVLLRAIAIGRRRDGLKASTLGSYRADIERRMDRAMARQPTTRDAIRLRQRYGRLREHLFTFLTDPSLPATNNGSEQDLRPSVIFRKVTNGFRAQWGADLFAGIRSVIDTGRRHALDPLAAITRVLAAQPLIPSLRPG